MNVAVLNGGCQSQPGAHLFSADSAGIASERSSSLNSTNCLTHSSGQSGNVSVNRSAKMIDNNHCANIRCLFYFLKARGLFICTLAKDKKATAIVNVRQPY